MAFVRQRRNLARPERSTEKQNGRTQRTNDEKGAIRDALRREVWPLIESGKIKPVVDRTYPLAEAGAAHKRMAGSEHIGKILLRID